MQQHPGHAHGDAHPHGADSAAHAHGGAQPHGHGHGSSHAHRHGHGHGHAHGDDPFARPGRYDLVSEFLFVGRRRSAFRRLIAAAGVQPGQRVLDVGCGTGYFAGLLARAVGRSGMVIGIDPAVAMIEHARRRRGGPNCQFHVGSAEKLALPDGSFDLVVSTLAMHHIPEDVRATAVREIYRVLRPGGRLLIAEMQMPRRPLERFLARLTGVARMAQHVPPLEPLAATAGFVDLQAGEALAWLGYLVATKPAPRSDSRPLSS